MESTHGVGVGVENGRKLNIVVEGCCHGELPKIYASVQRMEQVKRSSNANILPHPAVGILKGLTGRWYRAFC